MVTKKCRDCKKTLPRTFFYIKEKRKYATRYFSRCKRCYYLWVYEKDKKRGYRWHGTSQKNGPPRAQLRRAVKLGRIVKPTRCEGCGETFKKKDLDGHHHEGHDKPLKVRWLCKKCHRAEHAA